MKTLAIRLDDDLHAQISMLASLRDSTITDEIRTAIEVHLEASKADADLNSKAEAALEEINRDADARRAALATMLGTPEKPKPKQARRSTKSESLLD